MTDLELSRWIAEKREPDPYKGECNCWKATIQEALT